MNEPSIVIPASAYKSLEPLVQRAIMNFFVSGLGELPIATTEPSISSHRDEQGLARLSVADAKLFLNNCSDKTTAILQEIVNHDGSFKASDIASFLETDTAHLRGAWAGLTKRVRTITKDNNASLINWFKEGDDWRGIVAAQTVASMRVALEERA